MKRALVALALVALAAGFVVWRRPFSRVEREPERPDRGAPETRPDPVVPERPADPAQAKAREQLTEGLKRKIETDLTGNALELVEQLKNAGGFGVDVDDRATKPLYDMNLTLAPGQTIGDALELIVRMAGLTTERRAGVLVIRPR